MWVLSSARCSAASASRRRHEAPARFLAELLGRHGSGRVVALVATEKAMTPTTPTALLPLPPYTYGGECSDDEKVWLERDMHAYALAHIAAERERCAKILDANAAACTPYSTTQSVLMANAAAIREG
jgi:hypothetical protein